MCIKSAHNKFRSGHLVEIKRHKTEGNNLQDVAVGFFFQFAHLDAY